MKREIVSIAFILMLFVAMQFGSLPLVKATIYPDGYPDFDLPPVDYYLEGDLNHDGEVNIYDVVLVTCKYGYHEGDEGWDPFVDLNDDGVIDIYDVTIVTSNYGQREPPPVAYSTSFDFTVPNDGDTEVCYYVQVEFYVPPELDGAYLWLTGSVDDSVENFRICRSEPCGSGSGDLHQPLLRYFSEGFIYLLEFEYHESIGAGSLHFELTTSSGEKAWLVRFRIFVPNYSENPYEYTVNTETWCPILDDYFLIGYADDYIDDVGVDGTVWQDWEWDCGSYGAIYACGDGFCYPLGKLPKETLYDISFSFGEIWLGGLLDFRYVAWTDQREYWLTAPKFYATVNLEPYEDIITPFMNQTIKLDATFYGGSQWKDPEHPEISERNVETRLRINAHWNRTIDPTLPFSQWFDACFEIGLGKGWAEWMLSGGGTDDVGVTTNLTCLYFNTNLPSEDLEPGKWCSQWCLTLKNVTLDIFSCPWLEIPAIEHYPNGESIVNPNWTVATDYLGEVIMFVAGALQPEIGMTWAIIGSLVGLGIQGISAGTHYSPGQQLEVYQETITELHHGQLQYNNHIDLDGNDGYGPLKIFAPDKNPKSSINDIVFFQLNPVSGKRCGLTKAVLKGQIAALSYSRLKDSPKEDRVLDTIPLGELEIAICIPWFIWGLP